MRAIIINPIIVQATENVCSYIVEKMVDASFVIAVLHRWRRQSLAC
jgi:hypothetical protein